jgi:hypothetical protein
MILLTRAWNGRRPDHARTRRGEFVVTGFQRRQVKDPASGVHDIGSGSTTLTSLLEFSYIRMNHSNRIKGHLDDQSVTLLRWITTQKQRLFRCRNTVSNANNQISCRTTCRFLQRYLQNDEPRNKQNNPCL